MLEQGVIIALYALFCTGVVLILRSNFGSLRSVGRLSRSPAEKRADLAARIRAMPAVRNLRDDKIEKEIYESLSYMQNLIIAHKGGINSDSVISGLAEREGVLQETYFRMLSLLRTGRTEEAEREMREATGDTETGREFASLLMTWEEVDPERLTQIIGSYRRSIREACLTKQKKHDELISDFIYFPATANVFLIFINFIYISYFMEQKEMMQIML